MKRTDNAFPSYMDGSPGMTIEQAFIMAAMQGYITSDTEDRMTHDSIAGLAIQTAHATLNKMGL